MEENGVQHRISMTVNRLNIGDVGAMASAYGSRLNLQPLFHAGNANKEEDIAITGRERYEALSAAPAKRKGARPDRPCALCARPPAGGETRPNG